MRVKNDSVKLKCPCVFDAISSRHEPQQQYLHPSHAHTHTEKRGKKSLGHEPLSRVIYARSSSLVMGVRSCVLCVLHVGNKMKLIGRRRAESLLFICGGLAFFHSFPSRLSDQQMNFGCFFVVDSLPSYFLVENEISRQPHHSCGYIAQHFPRSPAQHQSPWTLIGPCCAILLGRRPLVAGAY